MGHVRRPAPIISRCRRLQRMQEVRLLQEKEKKVVSDVAIGEQKPTI
jgi:hypothetical protein